MRTDIILTGSIKFRRELLVLLALATAGCEQTPDKALAISEEEASAALQVLAQEQQSAMNTKAAENLAAGLAFLEQNATREGVTSLPSGLQYEILNAAQGAKPTATDTVTTHYHGTLLDGTVFDSSYERDQPASFPLNGVIAGWTEALQLMAVGAPMRRLCRVGHAYGRTSLKRRRREPTVLHGAGRAGARLCYRRR